ncbi:hypothetical protein GCM10008959_26340 [Deinococcus seoulensis]|uniref:Mechanosensitive ion channel family protein n=1 Tax=Deinococcus seoulensis TaxID=1837379 RepID=A0ABQ2RSI5_9DEIO|nr:hypothetical protein [Deinococcus seoulensis]GGR62984.1 hypothetical protein GCM10008959_26340 [Deinococcus seoulensis]
MTDSPWHAALVDTTRAANALMNTPLITDPEWSYLAVSIYRVLIIALLVMLTGRILAVVREARRTHPPLTVLALLEYGGLERWRTAVVSAVIGLALLIVCLAGQIVAGQVAGSPLGHLTLYLLVIYAGLGALCLGIGRGCSLLQEVIRVQAVTPQRAA